MAKIAEEHIIIKVSYLTKDENAEPMVDDTIRTTVESLVAEVIQGRGVVVEVIHDE